ncbi:MAG TPA: hypothetical protein VFE55_14330 [Acidimicrobiia bacterium]|nr:hypothetical protein [Acidimicrobiia bacterium]
MGVNRQQAMPVDWMRPGPLTADERAAVVAWYSEFHGQGDLKLAAFVPFWLRHDEQVFKRYRRWATSATQEGLSSAVGALVFLHHYTVIGWAAGALYEVVGARKWGITRTQVLETLDFAFLNAGPAGMAVVAEATDDELAGWTDDTEVDPSVWPDGWAPDTGAFSSGLDFTTHTLSATERAGLEAWYRDHQGEVPGYVTFLAGHDPAGLKAYRDRYEHVTQTLPKQMIPLMTLFTAAVAGRRSTLLRAAHQARRYGVTRTQLLLVLARVFGYAGDFTMEDATDVLAPLLDEWETP